MLVGLEHIAIAVPDLELSIRRFKEDFGLECTGQEDAVESQTSTAFLPIDKSQIELIHPLNGKGPVAEYLRKRPGGLHHLCFRSDNLDEDIERLKSKGYEFLSDSPQIGAHNCRVIFIHPKTCDGVLIELSQPV